MQVEMWSLHRTWRLQMGSSVHWQYKDLLNYYSLCFEVWFCSFRWVDFGWLCCVCVCLCSPCCPALRGTWSGSGRLFLRCSLAVWTPLLPAMRCASAPEGCGTKDRTWDKFCVKTRATKWVSGTIHGNSSTGVFTALIAFYQKTLFGTMKHITIASFTALWCWAMCFIPNLSFLSGAYSSNQMGHCIVFYAALNDCSQEDGN